MFSSALAMTKVEITDSSNNKKYRRCQDYITLLFRINFGDMRWYSKEEFIPHEITASAFVGYYLKFTSPARA